MNRRDTVLAILALVAPPLAAIAQQAGKVWRVGFLTSRHLNVEDADSYVGAFRQSMRELGYVEGQNLVIEWRSADNESARLPRLAAELVNLKVDVIVAVATPATGAAQKSTALIPIVMMGVGDPVGVGFIRSLARPGGNITGLSNLGRDIRGKQIELLLGVAPRASPIAVLMNPSNRTHIVALETIEAAAKVHNVKILRADAQTSQDIGSAFSTMRQHNAEALFVSPDLLFQEHREQIVQLAATHRLPAIGSEREFAEAGGLMSYGSNRRDMYRRAAIYVDKILKGAKPADLPVEQPTKFELVINLKTAKAFGLALPQSLLIRADELIK